MFIFPKAKYSSLYLRENKCENTVTSLCPKESDNFHYQVYLKKKKKIRKCSPEWLFCSKYFIALSPIIKMGK